MQDFFKHIFDTSNAVLNDRWPRVESIKWSSEPLPVWQLCMQNEIKRWNACRPVKFVKVQNSCLIDQPSANSCCWSSLPTFAIFLASLELPVLFFWTSHGFKPKWLQDGLYSKWTGTWAAFCIKKIWCLFYQNMAKLRLKKHAGFFMKRRKYLNLS